MVKGGHLNTAAREVLDLLAAERIDHIRRPRWIGYTRAKQLLDKLDDLLTHPKTQVLWYLPGYETIILSISYINVLTFQKTKERVQPCARPLRYPSISLM
jgi:hypothetical protein